MYIVYLYIYYIYYVFISINRPTLISCLFEFVLLGIALNRVGWCP